MTILLDWLNRYRPSTHTLVGLLTVFQTAYLADSEMQSVINRILGAHPMMHAVTAHCLLVLALYRNGAASDKK